MEKFIKSMLIVFSIPLLLAISCQKEVIAVSSVSLNAESAKLTEGEEIQLVATVSPNNAENKKVIWISNDVSIASVVDGKVTALKVGKATITVKTDDGGKTATCEVTVNAKGYPVTSVELDKTSVEMTEGDELTLTATVLPNNAINKNVTWNSSDNLVASVSNGKVTALKEGKATVIVKTEDGDKTATCEVTVNAKMYPVTSVTLDKTSVELTEGDEVTLVATVNPHNATNKNIMWSSSDSFVATVVEGKISALAEGMAIISVTTEDGNKIATCSVTVIRDSKNDPIIFADDVMKEMCVTTFDANADGILTYREAESVTDLSQMIITNRTFKTFDEFQYFKNVTIIPNDYFKDSLLESITLPSSVVEIGEGAFRNTLIRHIKLPESLSLIGSRAFQGCNDLDSITFPASVKSTGDFSFIDTNISRIDIVDLEAWMKINFANSTYGPTCHAHPGYSHHAKLYLNDVLLTNIVVPDNISHINGVNFGGIESIERIICHENVISIGRGAFAYCTNLSECILPNGLTTISNSTFIGCSSLQNIDLPSNINSIGKYAFESSGLIDIALPSTINTINEGTFYACENLREIIIPESVSAIENSAFSHCTNLKYINIPESVRNIGRSALEATAIESISLPPYLQEISERLFWGCSNLKEISISESIKSVGGGAFGHCSSMEKINLPASITSIDSGAFQSCTSLTEMLIPNSVTYLGERAFENCSSLTTIHLSESLSSISKEAFKDCTSLYSVNVPNGVKMIKQHSFYGCTGLTDVSIPQSVSSIGFQSFIYCKSLKSVRIQREDPPSLDSQPFYGCYSMKIYIPHSAIDAYKQANGWAEYASYIYGYDFENNQITD